MNPVTAVPDRQPVLPDGALDGGDARHQQDLHQQQVRGDQPGQPAERHERARPAREVTDAASGDPPVRDERQTGADRGGADAPDRGVGAGGAGVDRRDGRCGGHREQGGHVDVPVHCRSRSSRRRPERCRRPGRGRPSRRRRSRPAGRAVAGRRSPGGRRPHRTGRGGGRTRPAPPRDRRRLPGRSRPRRVRSRSPRPRPPRAAPPPQRRAARRGGGRGGAARTEPSRLAEPPAVRPARAGARGARRQAVDAGRGRPVVRAVHSPRRLPAVDPPACPSTAGRPPQGRPSPARTRGSAPSGIRCVACRRRSLFSFGVSVQARRVCWVVPVSELCVSCGMTPAVGRDHHRFYRGERVRDPPRGGFLPASHPHHVVVSAVAPRWRCAAELHPQHGSTSTGEQ